MIIKKKEKMSIELNKVKLFISIDGMDIELKGNYITISVESFDERNIDNFKQFKQLKQLTTNDIKTCIDTNSNHLISEDVCIETVYPKTNKNINTSNEMIVWPDGSCINNHLNDMEVRKSGIGIVFQHTLKNISEKIVEYLKSNTRSEMIAIIRAIEILNQKLTTKYLITIKSDSKVTIDGLIGNRHKGRKKCCDLWDKLNSLIDESIHEFNFIYIPRSSEYENSVADSLSKLAATAC